MENKKPILVVSTGAGMSAESGIQTFRDAGGLWENYPVMQVASAEGFRRDPELIHKFYNARRHELVKAQPNEGHRILAELEKDYDVYIITQNVDDLHERAGSSRVLHLHGELMKIRSINNPDYTERLDIEHLDTTPASRYIRGDRYVARGLSRRRTIAVRASGSAHLLYRPQPGVDSRHPECDGNKGGCVRRASHAREDP